MQDLPELIARLRYRLNLTQPQLATRLGVSESSVQHWEGGQQGVSPSTLMKLLHLAEREGDKEFPSGVRNWQGSAFAERVAKIRNRKDDIRPTVKALIKSLLKTADTCRDLAERAPTGAASGEKLSGEFETLGRTLELEATRFAELYDILSKIRENERETLRIAATEGR